MISTSFGSPCLEKGNDPVLLPAYHSECHKINLRFLSMMQVNASVTISGNANPQIRKNPVVINYRYWKKSFTDT